MQNPDPSRTNEPQPPHFPQDQLGREQPLPAGFEGELAEVERLLRAEAAMTWASMPRHLADQVYDATVGMLWPRPTPLVPLAGTRALSSRRFALAASLALTFVLAAAFSGTSPSSSRIDGGAVALAAPLSPDVEIMLIESSLGFEERSPLLETRGWSLDELHGDLERLVDELGG